MSEIVGIPVGNGLFSMQKGRHINASTLCDLLCQKGNEDAKAITMEKWQARNTPYYLPLYTVLYTGMRLGELLALRWCDVNLDMACQQLAEEIAQKLEGKSQDVRDAVRVARLSPQLGVDKAIHLLLT